VSRSDPQTDPPTILAGTAEPFIAHVFPAARRRGEHVLWRPGGSDHGFDAAEPEYLRAVRAPASAYSNICVAAERTASAAKIRGNNRLDPALQRVSVMIHA